jgi:hypothetical protein
MVAYAGLAVVPFSWNRIALTGEGFAERSDNRTEGTVAKHGREADRRVARRTSIAGLSSRSPTNTVCRVQGRGARCC